MARRSPEYNPESGVITVYADVGCPWAGLALHGLRRARERMGAESVFIDLRAFPLEVINGRPTPKPHVDAEVAVIGALEPSLGWQPWTGNDHAYPVTTLLALEAVQAAKRPEVGGLIASDALDAALRTAFFAESRCVSMLTVVLEVAEACPEVDEKALTKCMHFGAGRAEVITQCRNASDGAVAGSPHVFLPDGTEWHNPGVEMSMTGEHGKGFPRVSSYDPSAYEEIIEAARNIH